MTSNARSLKALILVIAMLVNLVALPIIPAHAAGAAADEYDTLRAKIYDFTTGGSAYDPNDPDISAKITAITNIAQTNWDTMDKRLDRSYLWSDLATTTESEHVSQSYQRLEAMTLAYVTRGSTLENNATLLADIISAMDWMYANRYNTSIPKRGYDNWFDWQVTSPLVINNITIWLYDHLTSAQISNWHAVIDYQALAWGPGLTGANRVWACYIKITSGIIVKNSAKIIEGRDQLSSVFDYATSGEGMYSDGSFLQHTALIPYNGGYGTSLLDNLTKAMYVIAGSSWDITDPDVNNIYQWIYNAFEPLYYNNSMFDDVRGRGIAGYRDDDKGLTSIKGLGPSVIRMALSAPNANDRAAYKSMVKKWLLEATSPTKYADLVMMSDIVQAKLIEEDPTITPREPLVMNKQYPNMARAVHHRPGFAFGISMSSNKIGNYELVNEVNLRGWHTGDGMTYLYNSDLAQYKDSYWATVNSYRMPGTTVIQNSTAAANVKNPNNWVGGTEISGLYGATGMQYTANGYNLTAKKSWFMFDDEIVNLGAGITSTDNKVVESIIENRKLNSSGDNALTVNGAAKSTALGWSEAMTGVNRIHLTGNVAGSDIGYYFPTPTTINGLREARTDQWSNINLYNLGTDYTTDITRNYMNLWFDHGTNPTDGTYDYVLLPGKSSEEVDQYANHPDIEVLANTSNVQAVKEKQLGITAINFWNDEVTTVGQITSNKKASVMIKETEEDTEVSVSDPTMANTGTIDLVLDTDFGDIVYLDPGVSMHHVDGKAKLSVNVKNAIGKTFKVKFRLPGKKQALSTPSGLTAVEDSSNRVRLTWNEVDRASTPPSAPTGLKVDGNTENSLAVEWDAVQGAADYRLYRSTSEYGDYYSISDLPSGALSYTDSNLESGTQYFYKVAAMNSYGMSSYSAAATGWTVTAPPTGLNVVSVAGTSISLAWNEVPGASEYRLYRSESLTGDYESLAGPVTTATFTDSGIKEGTNYYYKVAAMNPGGLSAASAPISTVFNIPAYALNESFDDMTRGELNGQRGWSATVPTGTVGGEIAVQENSEAGANVVLKKQSAGDPIVSHTFSVPAGAYVTAEVTVNAADVQYKTVLDVRDSTTGKRAVNIVMQGGVIWGYSGSTKVDLLNPMDSNRDYRLKAVINTATKKFDMYVDDQLAGSDWSYRESPVNNLNTIFFALAGTGGAMTLDEIKVSYVPAVPSNLAVTDRNGTGMKLTWSPVTGATGYRLYRSQDPNAGFQQVAELISSESSFTDSGLTPKTNYSYKIVTLSSGAISEASDVLTTSTTNAAGTDIPTAPIELYASDYTGSAIKLNWRPGRDAATYSIYRSTASGESFEYVGNTSALSYVDSGLDGATSYSYKVVAVNDEGQSPDSNIVSSSFNVVQTLIDDNFDNDMLGADPAGWTIVEDTGRPVTVVDAIYTATPGHAVRVTGGNKLATSAEKSFGEAQGIQGVVTVETLVQPKDANWKNIPMIYNPTNGTAAHVYFSGSQIIAYNSGNKATIYSPVLFDGTWYKTKIVMNTNNNKYDVFLNDSDTAAASQFGFRTVSTAVYGVKMAVDNVSSFDFDNVKAYFKPFAPTTLAASQNTNLSIKLTWNASTGASGYKLYRSTSANGGYEMVYSGSAVTYTDTGLQSEKTYYYKVAAVKGTAVSDASNMVTTATTSSPIAALQSMKNEVMILSIAQDPAQVEYIVYRDGVEVSRTSNAFYIDGPLESGRTYQYALAAYDNLGHTSAISLPVAYTVKQSESNNTNHDDPTPATGTPSTNAAAPKPQPDPKTGVAKIAVDAKAIADGFGQLTADAAGTKVLPIEVPNVEGATGYTVSLPAQALTAGTSAQQLELKTPVGSIIVPSNMLSLSDAVGAKEIGLTIAEADPSKLSDALKAQTGNRPVIELHVTADGNPVDYNNPDAPVKVSVPYKPTAEELSNPEHLVVWYIDGAGKAVSVPDGKYDPATGMMSFRATHFSLYAVAYVFKTFDDISAYGWAKDAIEVMAAKGIINGTSETTFDPGANISRADFSLLLVKSLGLSARGESNFDDVGKDAYYYDALATLKKLGIAQGSGNNKFSPNETISRQDMMVIAARALRVAKKLSATGTSAELNAFTDQSAVAAYAVEDVATMLKEGLIQGSGNFLNPAGFATRAEAAVMMYRMYHK